MIGYEPVKPRYLSTPADRVWMRLRFVYYTAQFVLVLIIGLRLGPNSILFHSVFSPGPADYVKYAEQYRPLIAAIKAYQRDFGKLPLSSDELPKEYQPSNSNALEVGEILNFKSITFQVGGYAVLEYEFSPAKEGWIIYSPRYDGPLPALKVLAAPSPSPMPSTSTGNPAPTILPNGN